MAKQTFIHLTALSFSSKLPPESAACLVVAAVFKTVEAYFGLGGFNSFPLRHLFSLNPVDDVSLRLRISDYQFWVRLPEIHRLRALQAW